MSPREPRVVDIRAGLTDEVLDSLRRADRVVLAVKTPTTAALGYWIDDELTIAVVSSAYSNVTMVPYRAEGVGAEWVNTFPKAVRVYGVVLDVQHAHEDAFWSRVLGVLRAGDVLRVGHDEAAPNAAALYVTSNKIRVAALRLPKRPVQRQSAA